MTPIQTSNPLSYHQQNLYTLWGILQISLENAQTILYYLLAYSMTIQIKVVIIEVMQMSLNDFTTSWVLSNYTLNIVKTVMLFR